MEWVKASDIKKEIKNIVRSLDFKHVDPERIICFRSFGSKAKAQARIWSLPRVWQKALKVPAYYIIEVISEKFDKLSDSNQEKILIHELLHIPKNFSGSLLPHRRRGGKTIVREVEKLFKQYKKNS